MKLNKSFWLRMLPVFLLVSVTLLLSVAVYNRMIETEKEECWERLEIATKSTAEKITVRLNDNLNFLEAISDSFILLQNLGEAEQVGQYLQTIMEMTIYERIDVLLPDGTMMTQNGEVFAVEGELSFAELAAKGTHISPRESNPFIGKEVIYCFTPIKVDGEVVALLSGTIACDTLRDEFEVYTYGRSAQIFLVDCTDGNYLIDNWHSSLRNVYDLGERLSIDGTEMIDLVTPIINQETGRMAFVSETNQKNTYQYYVPVEGFHWELCVAVQEDVVFAHVRKLEKILFPVGVAEVALMLIYLAWNIWLSTVTVKSEDKAKKLEMDRATNEAKSRFISNVSHDIRTPLNGIVGMLYIIKNHKDDPEIVDDCLEKIEKSTHYLSTLASDMLDINEIESDKLILEELPIDLYQLCQDLQVLMELKAQQSKVAYHVDCSKVKHRYVLGSVVHIKRILVNLIGNAIKYSSVPSGSVWVSIDELETNEERGLFSLVVRDNGVGMSEEFQENMYNAFAQEKISARSDYQGYGLGLTIVSYLVKKMNGTIDLKSKKGEGSTFTVTIPLRIDNQEHDETLETKEEIQPESLDGMRILLVEDNEINMEIATVLLTDAGAVIKQATNGKVATEIFAASKHHGFDLILMDIMMPEMDGCEATKMIRNMHRPDAKTIPIIAMTASTFAEEVKRCKDSGMNEHVAKPLDMEKLLLLVAKYGRKTSKTEVE